MYRKMLRKTMICGFIGIFLGMLILFPLVLNIPQVLSDKNQIIEQDNLENRNPFGQDNYDVLNSPFFENTTAISDWLKNEIIDNSTVQDNPDFPMYFSETSQNGSTITNYNHYFEDFAVFLDGLVYLLDMDKSEISQYFNTYRYSEFWDSNVSQQGYYSWVNSDWSDNSTVKELDGNSQVILTFIDWLISDQSNITTYNVENYISSQWNVQNDLFYDSTFPTYQVYNHSTVDDLKFSKDQFIAAIAGFLIHRANNGGLTIQDDAFSDANATMSYMIGSQFFALDTFQNRRESDLTVGLGFTDEYKFLDTNAYAIWALSEWYLELGAPEKEDQKYIDTIGNAEKVFLSLNNTLWNETYSLFMNGMDGSDNLYDQTITLKDNSIMLTAMQKLFEVTGNFTYYNVCMDMFNGIQKHFKDPVYGSYYTSINATETNKNRNLNTHSYLFRSLNTLSSLSERIDTNMSTNATEFIKKESMSVNITAEYFFDLYNYYDEPNAEINFSVPIENADFFFSVRFPNGTLAYNVSLSGDLDGKASIEFPFLDDYPLGEYTVDMYANYTGILTSFNKISFSLIPGFRVQEYTLESESIRAGSSTSLNLSINNTRMENLTVSIDLNGTNFANQTFEQVLFNGSLNNFTYEFTALSDASFGSTSLLVEIKNDTTLNYILEIPIVILSSIEIERIEQDAYVFHEFDFNILVELQNLVSISQTVNISISGEYITDIEVSQLLLPEESVIVPLNTQISTNALYGEIMYNLNITRASDGNNIFYEEFISTVKLPLDILFLDVPEISYHGKESQASCYIVNNLKTSQNISIFVDNQAIKSNLTLIPGENLVDIPFGQNFMNPYEFGNCHYLVEIVDSNGNNIYEQLISTELKASVGSILLGYALPIIIPIAGIVIVRHMALENKKRLS